MKTVGSKFLAKDIGSGILEEREEIDKLKEYVGTDEYIEDVAKEKLGLIKQNEILFKAAN